MKQVSPTTAHTINGNFSAGEAGRGIVRSGRFMLRIFLLLFIFTFTSQPIFADYFSSATTGDWTDDATWGRTDNKYPLPGDQVNINAGHVITYDGNLNWASGQIMGPNVSLIVTGDFTVSNSGNFNFWGPLVMDIAGDFIVTNGNLQFGHSGEINVGGNLDISGSLDLRGNNGQFDINVTGSAFMSGLKVQYNAQLIVGQHLDTNGNIELSENGILEVAGNIESESLTLSNTSSLSSNGILDVNAGISMSGNTLLSVDGTISSGSLSMSNYAFLSTRSNVVVDAGISLNSSTIMDVDGSLSAEDMYMSNTTLVVVEGDFNLSDDFTADSYANLIVAGDYEVDGTTSFGNPTVDVYVFDTVICSGTSCPEIENFDEWINPVPGIDYLSLVTAELDESGTFTVPSGISTIVVECWGGGGGGGNASHSGEGTSRGGGGAGGAYAAKTISGASGTYNYTVGAGGIGNTAGNASWFGSTSTVYAPGGAAGTEGDKNSPGIGGLGSVSGAIGDIVHSGGNGGNASDAGSGGGGGGAGSTADGKDAVNNTEGAGTADFGGAGGAGITTINGYFNGNPGALHGGGGSGAVSSGNPGTETSGGAGAKGKIRVTFSTLPLVKFDAATTNQTEAETGITITLSLNTTSSSDISIPFTISSSSTASGGGTDYTLNTNTPLLITAGNTTASISFSIHQDSEYEDNETIIIQLGTPSNAALAAPSSHIVFIVNDDAAPTFSLTSSSSSICLGDQLTFTAAVSGNVSCSDIQYYEASSDGGTSWAPIIANPGNNCSEVYTPTTAGTFLYRYYYYKNQNNNGTSNEVTVTVNSLPVINSPGNQTSCGPYTLPAITGTNLSGNEAYYTGSNGSGTQYNAGDVISNNASLYIYDSNSGCSDEVSFTISITRFNLIVSPNGASDCPDLSPATNPAFNPENTSYNHGATEVIFRVEPDAAYDYQSGWTFDFTLTGTVINTSNPSNVTVLTLEGNDTTAPTRTGSLISGSVDAGNNAYVDLLFQIENTPGSAQDINLVISNALDGGSCGETEAISDNEANYTIEAMPEVGAFN
ncbi:glycine-rich domain-containing protein [Roseimarinus sediminis]|uniref:glycine-rich domain-containing protein n=1 Tax=Roseimarinus sediminis TaxID=1610899 RepID=UPI003D1E2349